MKRKNLEKAIIMGLVAASISVPVWAADKIFNSDGRPGALIGGEYIADTSADDMIIINGGQKANSNSKGIYSEWSGDNLTISGYDNIIINTYGEIDENNNLIGDAYGASDGIYTAKAEGQKINITDFNKLKIIVGVSNDGENSYGMVANAGAKISIQNGKSLEIISMSGLGEKGPHGAISSGTKYSPGEIDIDVQDINILIQNDVAIQNTASTKFDISSNNIILNAKQGIVNGDDKYLYEEYDDFDSVRGADAVSKITVKDKLGITSKETSIFNAGEKLNIISSDIDLKSETNGIEADGNHKYGKYEGTTVITNKDDAGNLLLNNEDDKLGLDILAKEKGVTAVNKGKVDIEFIDSGVNIVANNTDSEKSVYGLYANDGNIDINTNKAISIGANIEKIVLTNEDGEKVTQYYGNKHSVKAEGNSQVNLIATDSNNTLFGVVYAKDEGTVVTLDHNIIDENGNVIKKGSGSNIIRSSAHGSEAEGRNHVVAALYAQSNGKIDISAGNSGINYITTEFNFDADDETEKESERTIWAQQGGKINIEGQTYVIASNADKYTKNVAGNARGIAVTAGTGETDFSQVSDFDIKDTERSTVTIKYLDGTGKNGNTVKSSITGDIVSGYGGLINIQALDSSSKANSTSGIKVNGNALAANGGKLNLDIGNGGVWTGRADDYGDAGIIKDGEHTTFFDPAFSNEIVQGGQVNLTMGEGSRWNVTGQSWITSINTGNSDIAAGTPIIDLVNANTDREKTAHALTIYNLNGNAIFNMSLDGDRDVSDMLYIKNAEGEYVINVVDSVSVDDMYKGGFDGLRFATIGDGSNVSFRAITYNQGINNVEYEVGQDAYNKENSEENDAYNSSKGDGEMSSDKPGSDRVEDFFDSTGTPENPQGPDDTEIMTLENTVESDSNVNGTTNFKLIGVKDSERSDGGKTVVNMSKVNYSNAIYMDRLNKRLGEARYINTEEDQGMWVRMRHDRIGKDNEFRIMNTMYELGYDEKQECDNGERRVGAAIDYMDGSSEYTGVGGSGDVSRKGIWLYDTWLGDKGHYSDFVAKWGHLSNDFTLYRGGDKITGDFSNNVYSISAEYGRKKDIGNNWYFEPQVQLQYARVTDANYTTSQGTEVSLDAINSLIARAGFRLGKDLGERSTVYFKADLLHEFLGDQDIYATDGTGTMDVTYGNEGTWCDIGFGFATAMSKTSYAYLDVETSLGNDYEETYQINAGLQWSF